MKLKLLFAFLAILGMCLVATTAQAEDVTRLFNNFGDVDGSGVDSYTGVNGDSWAGGWNVHKGGTGTTTATLETSSPIYVDSGNYMSYTHTDIGSDGVAASLSRGYYDHHLVDDYTVSFSLRFDDLSMWTVMDETLGKTTTDYFYMSGTNGDSYNHNAAETGWALRIQGIKADGSFLNGMHIRFMSSTVADEWTDFAVQEGYTYEFSIDVHPSTYSYDATVNEVGTANSYTTTAPHGYESNIAVDRLYFLTEMREQGGNTFGYSVDNINISESITLGSMTEVVAKFDDGNGDTTVDAYAGMAGNGWHNAWRSDTYRGTPASTITVDNTNEVHTGDGNYLSVSITNGDDSLAARGVSRNYKADSGLDFTANHTVEFTIRIDEADIDNEYYSTMTDVDDKYIITASDTEDGTVNGLDTFAIFAQGTDGDVGAGTALQWVFVDGNNDGDLLNCAYVASGISLTDGGVYDFTIDYDVTAKTYSVTVDDGVNPAVTQENLGWITDSDEVGGHLHFAASSNSTSDVREFSLDNVVISAEEDWIKGDANKDGFVNGSDAALLANNWQATGATWAMGDFTGDGVVDGSDAALLANNWQTGTPPTASAVPEPSTVIGLLTLLMAGFALTRRR